MMICLMVSVYVLFSGLQVACITALAASFEQETRQKDLENKTGIYWAGSSNQRVIDVKASISDIVELPGINRN